MTSKAKALIKAFFETGDKPTQAQFVDFIDSYVDSAGPIGTLESQCSAGGTGAVVTTTGTPSIASYATLQTSLNLDYVTTAAAVAGTGTTGVMSPVLVKNAVASLSTSAMVLLASATASNSATVDFADYLSSTYDHYILIGVDIVPQTDATSPWLRVSTNGSTFDANNNYDYAIMQVDSNGGATTPASLASTSRIALMAGTGASAGSGSTASFSFELHIFKPSDSARFKLFTFQSAAYDTSAHTQCIAGSGSYKATSAVRGVSFLFNSGNVTSGTFYLYGVKNS